MTRGQTWAGACAALFVLGAIWIAVPKPGPATPDAIRVQAGAAAQPTSGAPSGIVVVGDPAAPATATASKALTAPASDDPDQLYASVRSETRDPAWAARSEAVLRETLRRVEGVGGEARLEMRCGTTLCEVNGVAAPRAAFADVQRSLGALRDILAGDAFARAGLAPVASRLGTAHSENEFILYFRRAG